MNNKVKLEKWKIAQKRHRLSDAQVLMARELGFNPDKLGKLDNHKQESWKTPLPQYIENLYYKRFGKETPDVVKSIDQLLKEEQIKKEKHNKEKQQKRKAKPQEDEFPAKDKHDNTEKQPLTLSAKLKLYNAKPKIRIKLEGGDTPETILQKEAHIFDEAFELYEKENATFSELGFALKKIHPRYTPRRYGCKTLREIYEKLDKYEIIQTEGENIYVVAKK
ncbi:hypothetical protein D0T53_07620 [Dysgonomonas sp. 216]|nr:hypothetical protein [Dysgonomonas sp. 216]